MIGTNPNISIITINKNGLKLRDYQVENKKANPRSIIYLKKKPKLKNVDNV